MTSLSRPSVVVTLFQSEDLARIDELLEAVSSAVAQGATSKGPARVGDDDPVAVAAQEHDDFVTEATERAEKVTVQALPRRKFRDLVAKHPPREGNEVDAKFGFNTDTFGDDLMPFVDDDEASIRTIIAPEFANKAATERFLDDLSDGHFSQLYMAAIRKNREGSDAPKANLSSQLARISGATSTSHED